MCSEKMADHWSSCKFSTSSKILIAPGVVWKKATRAMRAMRGNVLETLPFQLYFGCTGSFLKVLSNEYFQVTRAMRAKQAVTVPVKAYSVWVAILQSEICAIFASLQVRIAVRMPERIWVRMFHVGCSL